MKRTALIASAAALAVALAAATAAPPALAGGGGHYRGDSHRWAPRHHYAPSRHHAPRYRAPRVVHRHGHEAAWLFGGLVLGTLLASPPVERTVVTRRVERVVVSDPVVVHETSRASEPAHDRYLLRDLEGRCYDVERRGGDEVRRELPPGDCG